MPHGFFADGYLEYKNGAWRDTYGEPVEIALVKHAEWVASGDGEYVPFVCTACCKTTSWYHKQTANYCPNCGAKMKGD